jgi:hypothetical protein
MIGNISPGSGSCENTLNTLRYADRVKELKKGGASEPISKEERMAKELMLPRNGKAKLIITNESDSEEDRSQVRERNSNANIFQTRNNQPTPNLKKPKYIVKDENDRSKHTHTPAPQPQRKNMLASQANLHQEPLKSVNHCGKPKQDGEKPGRNKSVVGKEKGNQSWLNSRAVEQPLISERNSFHKNNSLVAIRKDNLPSNSLNMNMNMNNINVQLEPHRPPPDDTLEQLLNTPEIREWERSIERFRRWQPSHTNFAEMSQLFE